MKWRSIITQSERMRPISTYLDQTSLVNKSYTAFHAFMLLCVCQVLLQSLFLKLINTFVFFVFNIVDAFGFAHSDWSKTHVLSEDKSIS